MMSKQWKARLGFASYDFSNSGYVAVFQAFLFPLVLTAGAVDAGLSSTAVWGIAVSVSSLTAVVLAPFVGRFADQVGKARIFTFLVALTAIFALLSPQFFSNHIFALIGCFIIFNVFFELSQSIYDSFLSNIESTARGITSLSSFAWGFGYLGGALFAAIFLGLSKVGVSNISMLSIFAFLYLILSLPSIVSFSRIERLNLKTRQSISVKNILKVKSPVPWGDIFIYWIIADAVAAVMYFTPIYLSNELALDIKTIGGLMLGGQLLAFPITIFMGKLANKIGRIRTLRIGLIIWVFSIIGLAFAQSLTHVIVVIVGLSFVIGSTQAILRAHFASRVDVDKSGEGLGFYAVAQKSASVIAPLLMATSALTFGSLRPSFLVLAALLLVAFIFATRLSEDAGLKKIDEVRP